MADFRRVVTALAVLALLTGFAVTASAQAPAFSCQASTAVTPLLRAEGLTELTGDIILNCSGGIVGSTPGTANFQVFLGNTTVTNRIDTAGNTDALLLVDEPGTAGNPATIAVGTNAFRGVITSANSVTFLGVPVVPSGTAASRVFRITNIRANASALGVGTSTNLNTGTLQALITISGNTSVPITNPLPIIGYVQKGLTFQLLNASGSAPASDTTPFAIRQCINASNTTRAATLRFSEGFATAFKERGSTAQSIPGTIFNTESGLVVGALGLADFGTRLKATFSNIPAGISVFVSTTNLPTTATTATATLTSSETGAFSAVAGTVTINATTSAAAVSLSSAGNGVAVWEVTTAPPLSVDTLDFGVYFGTTANPSGNIPAVTAATAAGRVAGSFAPTYLSEPTAGGGASATLPIPRFTPALTSTALVNVTVCRTNILFPFVTNQFGFDTGLAIANTSKDPFTTSATQSGTCVLNFFGDGAPSAFTTPSVAGGTVWTGGAETVAPGFQGYVIAVCNFQYAHGFAFVQSSVGYNATTAAMGYLGLIIPEDRTVLAGAGGSENLNQ